MILEHIINSSIRGLFHGGLSVISAAVKTPWGLGLIFLIVFFNRRSAWAKLFGICVSSLAAYPYAQPYVAPLYAKAKDFCYYEGYYRAKPPVVNAKVVVKKFAEPSQAVVVKRERRVVSTDTQSETPSATPSYHLSKGLKVTLGTAAIIILLAYYRAPLKRLWSHPFVQKYIAEHLNLHLVLLAVAVWAICYYFFDWNLLKEKIVQQAIILTLLYFVWRYKNSETLEALDPDSSGSGDDGGLKNEEAGENLSVVPWLRGLSKNPEEEEANNQIHWGISGRWTLPKTLRKGSGYSAPDSPHAVALQRGIPEVLIPRWCLAINQYEYLHKHSNSEEDKAVLWEQYLIFLEKDGYVLLPGEKPEIGHFVAHQGDQQQIESIEDIQEERHEAVRREEQRREQQERHQNLYENRRLEQGAGERDDEERHEGARQRAQEQLEARQRVAREQERRQTEVRWRSQQLEMAFDEEFEERERAREEAAVRRNERLEERARYARARLDDMHSKIKITNSDEFDKDVVERFLHISFDQLEYLSSLDYDQQRSTIIRLWDLCFNERIGNAQAERILEVLDKNNIIEVSEPPQEEEEDLGDEQEEAQEEEAQEEEVQQEEEAVEDEQEEAQQEEVQEQEEEAQVEVPQEDVEEVEQNSSDQLQEVVQGHGQQRRQPRRHRRVRAQRRVPIVGRSSSNGVSGSGGGRQSGVGVNNLNYDYDKSKSWFNRFAGTVTSGLKQTAEKVTTEVAKENVQELTEEVVKSSVKSALDATRGELPNALISSQQGLVNSLRSGVGGIETELAVLNEAAPVVHEAGTLGRAFFGEKGFWGHLSEFPGISTVKKIHKMGSRAYLKLSQKQLQSRLTQEVAKLEGLKKHVSELAKRKVKCLADASKTTVKQSVRLTKQAAPSSIARTTLSGVLKTGGTRLGIGWAIEGVLNAGSCLLGQDEEYNKEVKSGKREIHVLAKRTYEKSSSLPQMLTGMAGATGGSWLASAGATAIGFTPIGWMAGGIALTGAIVGGALSKKSYDSSGLEKHYLRTKEKVIQGAGNLVSSFKNYMVGFFN